MKPRKRINPISAKRAAEMRIYAKRRKLFLAANPLCEYWKRRSGIRVKSTEIHHTRGRAGTLYLDERYWVAVSRSGHQRIEKWPNEAKAFGLIGPWGEPGPRIQT